MELAKNRANPAVSALSVIEPVSIHLSAFDSLEALSPVCSPCVFVCPFFSAPPTHKRVLTSPIDSRNGRETVFPTQF